MQGVLAMNYVESVRLEKPISYINDRDTNVFKEPPKPKDDTMSGYCSRCGETICICNDITDESPINFEQLLHDCNRSYTHLNELTQNLLTKVENLTKTNSKLEAYLLVDSETIATQVKRIEFLEYLIWKASTNNNTNEDWNEWDYQVVPIVKTVQDRLDNGLPPPKKDRYNCQQPKREPLSIEDIKVLYEKEFFGDDFEFFTGIVKAIEQAHGIGTT